MHKIRVVAFFVAVVGSALAVSAQTAEEIVAKHLQAQGGVARMRALSTVRVAAYFEGYGMRGDLMEVKKRPDKLRRELHVSGGASAVEAYDGRKGWKIDPGKTNVELVVGDELKTLLEDADFDGSFVDYKQKGHKIELVGKEKFHGADAYNLKVTLKGGKIRNHYISADSFLDLGETGTTQEGGKETPIEITNSDFRDVKGFKVPFHAEHHSQTEQGDVVLKFTVTAYEFDVSVDDSIFQMPAAPPAVK